MCNIFCVCFNSKYYQLSLLLQSQYEQLKNPKWLESGPDGVLEVFSTQMRSQGPSAAYVMSAVPLTYAQLTPKRAGKKEHEVEEGREKDWVELQKSFQKEEADLFYPWPSRWHLQKSCLPRRLLKKSLKPHPALPHPLRAANPQQVQRRKEMKRRRRIRASVSF
jgi:hypothetical protein